MGRFRTFSLAAFQKLDPCVEAFLSISEWIKRR
jgi:hypothetical protein